MFIKQISVFVENKFGRIAAITDALSQKNIDISALSMADTTDFGVLRMIVDKPKDAISALKEIGVMAKSSDVLAVALEDKPGGLNKVLGIIAEKQIVIEYMYAFVGKKAGKALMVVKSNDMPKTEKILEENGITLINLSDIY